MNRRNSIPVLLMLLLSGFAGLGYEMIWTRLLAFGLGHEMAALLAVMAAFFCGLASGARALDRLAATCRHPHRLYALLETVIGVWSLLLIRLIPAANRHFLPRFGLALSPAEHGLLSLAYAFVLLLPATFAMGATLPVMERLVSARRGNSRSVALLYAVNTLGAMAGTLVTTFYLAPRFGFAATLGLLAVLNLGCALAAFRLPVDGTALDAVLYPDVGSRAEERRLAILLFGSGLLGIGFEVVVIRLLGQILQSTVYTFACILSVYLCGTALGAALYPRAAKAASAEATTCRFVITLSGCILFSAWLIPACPAICRIVLEALGAGLAAAVLAELAAAAAVFLLPTLLMGLLFSHLAQQSRTVRGGLGRALCINTLGAAIAPILFGAGLIPFLGTKGGLLMTGLGYLLLLPRRQWKQCRMALVPAALAGVLLLIPFERLLLSLEEGDRLIEQIEGVSATVSVIERQNGHRVLKVNNRFQMGGTAAVFSDRRQGHIPLLLHPAPQRVLFLGLGTGATFAAAAEHPGLEADAVELLPEVPRILHYFEAATGDLNAHPRLHIVTADARRFVNRSPRRYDVIIADLFHPARDGAGTLYTREHFAAVRDALEPDGLFCQWLPLYQMDLETVQTITRTFIEIFPDTAAFMTHYNLDTPIIGLIGMRRPQAYPVDWFAARVADPATARNLERIRIRDFYSLFGCFLAGSEELRAFAESGSVNTDDHPVVMYRAPRFTYSQQEPPHVRLLALIDTFSPAAGDILSDAQPHSETAVRLETYWQARNAFLRLGCAMGESSSAEEIPVQVREPLLGILRMSPDFEAAYDPLIGLAAQLYPRDPEQSRQLLRQLEALCPRRAEAGRILGMMQRDGQL